MRSECELIGSFDMYQSLRECWCALKVSAPPFCLEIKRYVEDAKVPIKVSSFRFSSVLSVEPWRNKCHRFSLEYRLQNGIQSSPMLQTGCPTLHLSTVSKFSLANTTSA